MNSSVRLDPFLNEFSNLTTLLQQIVPEVNQFNVTDATPQVSDSVNEEVYSGLPTIFNARKLSVALSQCIPESLDTVDEQCQSVRSLLTRLELIAIWANTYNLTELECRVWKILASIAERRGRYLDASYALLNQAFIQILTMESEPNRTEESLRGEAKQLCTQLRDQFSHLLDAVDEAVRNGQLPTPHAHLQCVIVSMATAYLEHYANWTKFVAQLDLIPIYFNDFFTTKSWAAVCARGYLYWIRLHARCMFASSVSHEAPVMPTASRGEFHHALHQAPVTPLPDSLLHAANVVRMHGRTLVKFMRTCCEQKLGKQHKARSDDQQWSTTTPRGDEKENSSSSNQPDNSSKTFAWSSSALNDSDLLNIWLGTRLFIRGCIQVAELYTLMGTVREARAFQEELLRLSQRFHLCGCAQTALTLMAHLDMFGQRKWAFELRLRQLQHIYTSTLSLDEIVRETRRLQTHTSKESSEDVEDKFLRPNTCQPSIRSQIRSAQQNTDAFDVKSMDSLSAAANPLMAANVGAFASIFPCSPTRRGQSAPTSLPGFPSHAQVRSLIMGSSHKPTKLALDSDAWDGDVINAGGVPLTTCADRVLNGVCWPWLAQIILLVRKEVVGRTHFLPVCIPSVTSNSLGKENDETRALINALNDLASSPNLKQNNTAPQSKVPSTTRPMLPPAAPPPPNAPRRLPGRSSRTKQMKQSRSVTSCAESVRKTVDRDQEEEYLSLSLVPRPPSRRQTQQRSKKIAIYVDNEDDESPSRADESDSKQQDDFYDPVESCPPLASVQPRPRNLRLASHWNAVQQRSVHRSVSADGSPPDSKQSLRGPNCVRVECVTTASVEASLQQLTERLTKAYSQLTGLPIPNLIRPICHWLGLRWLDKGSQSQAGRFFGQSVGVAPTNLFMSILSSRLWEAKSSFASSQLDRWFRGFQFSRQFCIPSHPLLSQGQQLCPEVAVQIEATFPFTILQFCLVDEISVGSHFESPTGSDKVGSHAGQVSNHLPLGLGAKSEGYLVVTKYSGLAVDNLSNLRAETRIMHQFTQAGLKSFDDFDQLQVESMDSMQLEERVHYWRTRYELDSRLETFLDGLRRDWFTKEDLAWLMENVSHSHSAILVLDRRLNYLPWEWILRDSSMESHQSLTITRNLSVPLIMAHSASQNDTNSTSFDPHQTFYVLNPEANLSFTERVFQPLFDRFSTWRGVTGREPSAAEVNSGFADNNLFVYLGHGSGSRFLLQTFSQGLNTQAVVLVLGCSSGKPRWEGRHEPYSSLVNHLLSGCPCVAGVLWDVTDRDMDRFTWEFFTQWLLSSSAASKCPTQQSSGGSLGQSLSRATAACKLKHLVGKSVIVYGIPAEPAQGKRLSLPDRVVSELKQLLK